MLNMSLTENLMLKWNTEISENTLIKHIYFVFVKLIKSRVLIQLQSDYVINLIRYFQM